MYSAIISSLFITALVFGSASSAGATSKCVEPLQSTSSTKIINQAIKDKSSASLALFDHIISRYMVITGSRLGSNAQIQVGSGLNDFIRDFANDGDPVSELLAKTFYYYAFGEAKRGPGMSSIGINYPMNDSGRDGYSYDNSQEFLSANVQLLNSKLAAIHDEPEIKALLSAYKNTLEAYKKFEAAHPDVSGEEAIKNYAPVSAAYEAYLTAYNNREAKVLGPFAEVYRNSYTFSNAVTPETVFTIPNPNYIESITSTAPHADYSPLSEELYLFVRKYHAGSIQTPLDKVVIQLLKNRINFYAVYAIENRLLDGDETTQLHQKVIDQIKMIKPQQFNVYMGLVHLSNSVNRSSDGSQKKLLATTVLRSLDRELNGVVNSKLVYRGPVAFPLSIRMSELLKNKP